MARRITEPRGFSLTARKISEAFPTIGAGFQSLAIAAVAINEMTGPILFKFALDRAGETQREEAVSRTSLVPPAPVQ